MWRLQTLRSLLRELCGATATHLVQCVSAHAATVPLLLSSRQHLPGHPQTRVILGIKATTPAKVNPPPNPTRSTGTPAGNVPTITQGQCIYSGPRRATEARARSAARHRDSPARHPRCGQAACNKLVAVVGTVSARHLRPPRAAHTKRVAMLQSRMTHPAAPYQDSPPIRPTEGMGDCRRRPKRQRTQSIRRWALRHPGPTTRSTSPRLEPVTAPSKSSRPHRRRRSVGEHKTATSTTAKPTLGQP